MYRHIIFLRVDQLLVGYYARCPVTVPSPTSLAIWWNWWPPLNLWSKLRLRYAGLSVRPINHTAIVTQFDRSCVSRVYSGVCVRLFVFPQDQWRRGRRLKGVSWPPMSEVAVKAISLTHQWRAGDALLMFLSSVDWSTFSYLERTKMQDFDQNFSRGCYPRISAAWGHPFRIIHHSRPRPCFDPQYFWRSAATAQVI